MAALLCWTRPPQCLAEDGLEWDAKQGPVSADIKAGDLYRLLGQISSVTSWQVFLEPGIQHTVSAKFQNLPPGEALRKLLGDLNFAVVPEGTNRSRLLVFRTSQQRATQLIERPQVVRAKVIANELIVRLKPGAKIDDLARMLGAKVVGRLDGLNAYRLRFDDAPAADAARTQLATNPDVAAVDSNYSIDNLPGPARSGAAASAPPQLQIKPPPENGRVIIGLIDTAVQPLGNGLDAFLLKPLSVAGQPQLDTTTPDHGTAMAETMLSGLQTMTKGSTSVQILPVDVYGPNASTSTFDVATGIAQAVNAGANIINLSLGSNGDSPFLHTVIQDANSKNVVFFGAAGNSPVTAPFYPAAYPEVNAVTAIDQGQLAPYADRGSWISLGAPGTSVVYFNNQPWSVEGTSTSAAYLSATLAGYMDANHVTADKALAFIRNNFGISITPGK